MRFKLREDVIVEFKNDIHQKDASNFLGISEKHLSQVLNRKAYASKPLAIAIAILNKYGNLEYFFEEVQ